MSKIVVLNSGGYDSVTLINYLKFIQGEEEIYSLHFTYGEPNKFQQVECVNKVCKKVGAVNTVINLPPFVWTKGDFYDADKEWKDDTQYLEYRNLIFLSYAVSYAESIGADKIYLATMKGNYTDTSRLMFDGLNSFLTPQSGIEILAPFSIFEDKMDTIHFAIRTGVQIGDYYSCDKPDKNGIRCGKCPDCMATDAVNSVLKVDHPFKALYQSNFDYEDTEFLNQIKKEPAGREVRALINNDCQLQCKHCFYGFKDMVSEQVDKETYYKALKELVLIHGFNNIHFSGKEPLYDDTILWYADKIKEDRLPCTFDLVTNGINVPKYIHQLKESGINKVFLSVDEVLDSEGVRSVKGVYQKAIESCNTEKVPVEVFIDLHHNNWNKVSDIIEELYNKGVKQFYVRTIRSIGNAVGQELLGCEQLCTVFEDLKKITQSIPEVFVNFSISSEYIPIVYESENELAYSIKVLDSLYSTMYYSNLCVFLEAYCNRYADITLTPDGYVLGCASEVSRPDYDKISAGNIKTSDITSILKMGSVKRFECQKHFPDKNYCCMMNKI